MTDWGFETNCMCAQTAGSPFSADPLLSPWVLETVEAEQTILAENAGHQGKENVIFQKLYERSNVRYLHNAVLSLCLVHRAENSVSAGV